MAQHYHQPDERWIRIYGTELFNCPPDFVAGEVNPTHDLKIIKVSALGKGPDDTSCLKVEPFYLLVWGMGQMAECCTMFGSLATKVWTMKSTSITAQLEATTGTAEEILGKYIR